MKTLVDRMRRMAVVVRQKLPFLGNKYVRTLLLVLLVVALVLGSGFGYARAITPTPISNPEFEHLHFRMQVLVDGRAVNFAEQKFQEGYAKDNCNVDLTRNPIHFHDSKDQFVHIHWKHLTGGQVLKYYGWNYIGGVDGMLGYRFDNFPNLQTVPIHGSVLPRAPENATMHIYTGDESGYQKRSFDDFTKQDLEQFFGKQSNVQSEELTLLDRLFPKVSAHGGHDHEAEGNLSQEDLKRINNLLGNVVIFAQEKAPTDAQVKDRFNKLAPLSASSCAG